MTDEQRAKKAEASRRYREKNRGRMQEVQKAYRATPEGREKARAAARQSMAKRRTERPAAYWFYSLKKRSEDLSKEFDLTEAFLEELLHPMVCSATGLPLQHSATCKVGGRGDRNPWAPSVDRRDSTRGYTQDNVWLTCWAFNMAKGPWTEDVFLAIAQGYLERANGHNSK